MVIACSGDCVLVWSRLRRQDDEIVEVTDVVEVCWERERDSATVPRIRQCKRRIPWVFWAPVRAGGYFGIWEADFETFWSFSRFNTILPINSFFNFIRIINTSLFIIKV